MANMTFNEWRKAMNYDSNLAELQKERKAAYVVRSAEYSRRSGQLSRRGFKAAIRWAYRLDHSAAFLECRRCGVI